MVKIRNYRSDFQDLNRILRESIFNRNITVKICHCFCVRNISSKSRTVTCPDNTFFHPETLCRHKRKKLSIHLELPAARQISQIPQGWPLCLCRITVQRMCDESRMSGLCQAPLLLVCRFDLCAHTKFRAVPALHDLVVVRFPRWKKGSLRWMCKQKKGSMGLLRSLRDKQVKKSPLNSHIYTQQLSTCSS